MLLLAFIAVVDPIRLFKHIKSSFYHIMKIVMYTYNISISIISYNDIEVVFVPELFTSSLSL